MPLVGVHAPGLRRQPPVAAGLVRAVPDIAGSVHSGEERVLGGGVVGDAQRGEGGRQHVLVYDADRGDRRGGSGLIEDEGVRLLLPDVQRLFLCPAVLPRAHPAHPLVAQPGAVVKARQQPAEYAGTDSGLHLHDADNVGIYLLYDEIDKINDP